MRRLLPVSVLAWALTATGCSVPGQRAEGPAAREVQAVLRGIAEDRWDPEHGQLAAEVAELVKGMDGIRPCAVLSGCWV